MNVLSLFDGMSCGQEALKQLGVKVDNYFASEIDPYAIKIARKNHQKMIHLPSVEFVSAQMMGNHKIDLVIGGSPCQSFSRVGDGSGFDGSSRLFWEYVRILNDIRENNNKDVYFLLENVAMRKEWEQIITDALGVEPIKLDASHFGSNMRKRLYWTNIPLTELPPRSETTIGDVIESSGEADWMTRDEWPNFLNNEWSGKKRIKKTSTVDQKGQCMTATMYKGQISTYVRKEDENGNPYAVTKLTPRMCEMAQGVAEDYTEGVSKTQRYRMIGNGWHVPTIKYLFTHFKNQ